MSSGELPSCMAHSGFAVGCRDCLRLWLDRKPKRIPSGTFLVFKTQTCTVVPAGTGWVAVPNEEEEP